MLKYVNKIFGNNDDKKVILYILNFLHSLKNHWVFDKNTDIFYWWFKVKINKLGSYLSFNNQNNMVILDLYYTFSTTIINGHICVL